MARSPGQRGRFGAWLTAEREKRYETQADALAAYRRLGGLVISESEYAQWESGSRVPKEENPKRLALLKFYGSAPEEGPVAAPAPDIAGLLVALTNAIDRQTQALLGRFELLEAGQVAGTRMLGQVKGEVEALRALAEPQTDTPPTGTRRNRRSAHAGTGGSK